VRSNAVFAVECTWAYSSIVACLRSLTAHLRASVAHWPDCIVLEVQMKMHKSKKSSYQFYWTLGWKLVFLSSSNFLGLLGWKIFLDS
jgi:hypothetical protein